MKTTLSLIVGLLFFNSCPCNATKHNRNSDSLALAKAKIIMDEFKITKIFERFDEQRYEQRKDRNDDFVTTLPNGTRIELGKWGGGMQYSMQPKDSFLQLLKLYYLNGNIKSKGFMVNYGNARVGTWYEFSVTGGLINTINYDDIFTFTFNNIILFCNKRSIILTKGYVQYGFKTEVNNYIESSNCWWKIEYLKKEDLIEVIKIDGKTGRIISVDSYEYVNI